MNRPCTTLFMLMSIDGKISTGLGDSVDFDTDIPKLCGDVKEGLQQYYNIEQTTSLWSLCTGRTKAKIGVNEQVWLKEKTCVNHVIVDNSYLKLRGMEYLRRQANHLVIVTRNNKFEQFFKDAEDVTVYRYTQEIDFKDVFRRLYNELNCEELTIQSGGTLNSILLREGLIDNLDIVVTPLLVGGLNTPTLIDGQSMTNIEQVKRYVKALSLDSVEKLDHSYIRLRYKIIN